MTTYCVWARVPSKSSMEGWSRLTGELTKEAAELYAEQTYFETTVMTDQNTPPLPRAFEAKTRRY